MSETMFRGGRRLLALAVLAVLSPGVTAQEPPRLLIAFASHRERAQHPKVYFYEHDGGGAGKLVGSVDAVNQRSDFRPSLSADGRWCAFAAELENQTGKVLLWDRTDRKLADLPGLNDTPNGLLSPSLSGDGKLLALSAWNRPGAGSRWAAQVYDVPGKKFLELPGHTRAGVDARMTALSGDGRTLATVVTGVGGAATDVQLYDRVAGKVIEAPGLNSPRADLEPALNGDGSLVAFVSDRPGGRGGRDVYLYDRAARGLVALPGLNGVGHEQSPALSPGGRFVLFVAERVAGAGERDVYLYDRKVGRLLPTPGLNSKAEDFDPCVVVVAGKE